MFSIFKKLASSTGQLANISTDRTKFISDETAKLDETLKLLSKTTNSVTSTAVETTRALMEQLQFSEYRFFSTIDAVEDVIVIKDGHSRWKTVNLFGQKIFGFKSYEEYTGKSNEDLIKTFPHLKEWLDYSEQTDEKTWILAQPFRFNDTLTLEDGVHHFDIIKTPTFYDNGARKEMIVIARDVTDLYNKQKRMMACFIALNSVSDSIVILDKNARIFFSNDSFISEIVNRGESADKVFSDIEGRILSEVIPSFVEFEDMWASLYENKIWKMSMFGKYNISAVPMLNGSIHPIYHIITFKNTEPHNHSSD